MNNIQSPRTDDAGLEARLAKSPAPRVTLTDLKNQIADVYYFRAADGVMGSGEPRPDELVLQSLDMLTFCVIVMKNGFTVTGESACASPENFDPLIGRQIAYNHALDKMWPLLGYQLKDRLFIEQHGSAEVQPRPPFPHAK